jgi:predicted nuclease with TOPRIM domain
MNKNLKRDIEYELDESIAEPLTQYLEELENKIIKLEERVKILEKEPPDLSDFVEP